MNTNEREGENWRTLCGCAAATRLAKGQRILFCVARVRWHPLRRRLHIEKERESERERERLQSELQIWLINQPANWNEKNQKLGRHKQKIWDLWPVESVWNLQGSCGSGQHVLHSSTRCLYELHRNFSIAVLFFLFIFGSYSDHGAGRVFLFFLFWRMVVFFFPCWTYRHNVYCYMVLTPF